MSTPDGHINHESMGTAQTNELYLTILIVYAKWMSYVFHGKFNDALPLP